MTPQASNLILVADDEPSVRGLIRRILEREGFQTVGAEDGVQTVELVIERQPALVILDIWMPRMDGYAALTRLHADPTTREIPVIILTGQAGELYQGASSGLGAVAHLTKPFRPRDLLEVVRRYLPQSGGSTAHPGGQTTDGSA